jgi:AbrB family looped-hinge helix DNA binding protein
MKATLTSKGRITIPQAIRDRLHLRAGDILDFDEDADAVLARRVIEPGAWNTCLGEIRTVWARSWCALLYLRKCPWVFRQIQFV